MTPTNQLTRGAGLGGIALVKDVRNTVYEKDVGRESAESEWTAIGSHDDSQRQELQYTPVRPHLTTPDPTVPTTISPKDFRLQSRQDPIDPDEEEDDNDGDDDDEKTPPPAPPAGTPDPVAESSRISSVVSVSVSASVSGVVSSTVAAAVSAQFTTSLQALSASASTAIQNARESGRAEGFSSATAGIKAPTTTEVATTTVTTTPIASTGSTTSSVLPTTTTTDEAAVIASIQASASKAIEDAKASASSSAQSAIDAADAGKNTAIASVSDASTQGSSLTPGQIGGIVISIAIVAATLSALATYLLMRRRQRQRQQHQEPRSKFEPDSPPESRNQAQGPTSSLRSPLTSLHLFMAGARAGAGASQAEQSPAYNNTDFIPDVKQRVPPPPDAEHPAMSYAARPLSMPGPEGFDPVFPVSPLSSEGEPSAAGGGGGGGKLPAAESSTPWRRRSPTGLTDSGTAAAAVGLSLARQQSINNGGRAQLVRVGSSGSEKKALQQQHEKEKGSAGPLAMNPVVRNAEAEWRLFPTTKEVNLPVQPQPPAKDEKYVAGRTGLPPPVPVDHGTPSPLLVQAPVPRRPVDPFSLEQGTAW
ncbi:hypothetical protein Hte_004073 [Hypoxylon texense]